MSAEVALSVVAIAVSVCSILWTTFSASRHGQAEKRTAAARAEESLHIMYGNSAQKAMAFISIYAHVPGKPNFNPHLAEFMKNHQHRTWNALCGRHPSAADEPDATGNTLLINKEIRKAWLSIREACQVTESFWDFLFEQANHGHLPADMIQKKDGRMLMKGRWVRRAFSFLRLVEPLAVADLAYMDVDAEYSTFRPSRFTTIENLRENI